MKEIYMRRALIEAQKAMELGEVPIGAIIVKEDKLISKAHNLCETAKDPTAHAEMLAIRQAAENLGGWRLNGCDIYVTVEPCPMCAGAIVLARIKRLFIGTMDPKGGAAGSLLNIPEDKRFNHIANVETGVLESECSAIIKEFFKQIRNKDRNK